MMTTTTTTIDDDDDDEHKSDNISETCNDMEKLGLQNPTQNSNLKFRANEC